MFNDLVGEVVGVEYAPIRIEEDGRSHRLSAGDALELEVEDFAGAAEGSVTAFTNVGHPANTTLNLGQAKRARVTVLGFDWSQDGRNGHSAPFSWAA
jgi:hypothetical protein